MSLWSVLADAVLVVHLAFVIFVVLGGLLAWRRPWIAWLHLPSAGWGALVEFLGWPCPLTPLEQWLRWRAGEGGYSGGFVEHYLLALVYPEGLGRDQQLVLGTLVVFINVLIYTGVWRAVRRRRGA